MALFELLFGTISVAPCTMVNWPHPFGSTHNNEVEIVSGGIKLGAILASKSGMELEPL